jgi:invasion protein IalB
MSTRYGLRMAIMTSVLFATLASVIPSNVKAASELPGGASTLRETYDNWVLNCAVQRSDGDPKVTCSVSVEQIDKPSKRRLAAIAVTPSENNGAKGSLLLPFGLSLQNGATLQVDDGPVTDPLLFRTCLPSGCIVSLDWNGDSVNTLRRGSTLKIGVQSDGGQAASFSLPLKGLAGGLDRAIDLAK